RNYEGRCVLRYKCGVFMWVRKLASSRCNLRYGVGSLNQEKRFYINIPFSHCSLSPSSITVLCTLHCRLIHHSSLRFAFCTRIFFHPPSSLTQSNLLLFVSLFRVHFYIMYLHSFSR